MKQEQLLAQRDELARKYHLGELKLYRTPWTSEGWAIYAVVIASVALALFVLVTIINGQAQDAIYPLVLGGIFYQIFLSDHTSVYVYSNGLVCLRRSGGRVVHWGEISKVWMSGGRSATVLNAMLNDGTKIRFPTISSQGSASTSSPCEMGPVEGLESTRLDTETMTVCKKEGKCGTIQEKFKERWKKIPPC